MKNHKSGMTRFFIMSLAACALAPLAANADKLCSLQKGLRGKCKDNGCIKTAGMLCTEIRDSGLVVDCKCRAKGGGRATMAGANVEIAAGGYLFDGTTLILGSLVATNTYDYETGTQNPGDPVIGSMLILPPLTAAGMKHFNDGQFDFDYFSFENTQNGPLVLEVRGTPLVIAEFAELAFFPDSQAWGLLLDDNRQYNNGFLGSPTLQLIQDIDQSDPEAFPGIVLIAADDAFGQTNGFTTPHNGGIAASNFGLDVVFLCVGDWNEDGDVNTLDLLAFLNDWAAGNDIADINGDGQVNTQDVLAFLNAWNQGC